nr:enoyl-CoA hydratase-related protein [Cryobacterium sp. Y29]
MVSSTARLGMPIARLGILAPASFANRLSLRVGPSRAKAVLFDTQLLTAQRAERLGLVTTLVADHAIDAALAELLAAWGAVSAASLRAAKAAVDLGLRPVAEPARRAPMGLASDPEEFSRRVSSFLHHTP